MTTTHSSAGWWSLTAAWAVLIAIGALIPIPSAASQQVGWLDKPIHLCEYLVFAWCLVRAGDASMYPHATTFAIALLASTTWGFLLEGLQMWLPYRSAEWADVAANLIGSIAGSALGAWWMGRTS